MMRRAAAAAASAAGAAASVAAAGAKGSQQMAELGKRQQVTALLRIEDQTAEKRCDYRFI